jgi:hypothetical protein
MKRGLLALAGVERPFARCAHEAGLVTVGWAGSSVVGEITGGYRLAGDLLPPPFPAGGFTFMRRSAQQLARAGSSGDAAPLTGTRRSMAVQENLTR